MALDNLQIDYLIDPAFQIENLAGKPAVGGHIEVFEAGTDTKVITYQDFDGNVNPFKIPLHSDGRAVILADPSRKYDFYVYDSFNNLMFSRLNVTPNLSGNISITGSDVVIYNTDGTLDITQQSIQNNIRRYEINTKHKSLGVEAPLYFVEDSDSATIIGFSGDDYATKDYVDSAVSSKLDISSYSSQSGDFLTDKFEYDDNNNITAYNHSAFAGGGGSGAIYEAGDHIDITDNVISVTGLPTSSDVENAISSAVTNVENKFEYNENNYITAYNNSAFAGTNYSAGDYVSIENDTISVTGLQPSGDYATHDDLTAYQPAGDYYSASNPSGFITNDAITGLQPSGDYATKEDVESATSGKQDTLSAGDGISIVNNTISVTSQGGGIEQVNHDDTLSGNGNDEPLGIANIEDFVKQNDLTAYQEKGDYYSASNPSGFITNDAITGLQPSGDYATHDDLTGYATTSLVSSVSSELYSAISGISGDFELVAGSGVELVDDPNAKTTTINVTAEGTPVTAIEQMIESATSGISAAISGSYTLVAGNGIQLTDDDTARTTTVSVSGDYATTAQVADKLDTTAFSTVSGNFLTAVPESTVSGFIPYSASGVSLPNSNFEIAPDGRAAIVKVGHSTDYTPSWINDTGSNTLSFAPPITLLAGDTISFNHAGYQWVNIRINGTNVVDEYISGSQYTYTVESDVLVSEISISLWNDADPPDPLRLRTVTIASNAAQRDEYVLMSELTSANFYPSTNPSGFITGVDLTPYQTTAGMTGYLTTADSANFYTNDNPSGFITGVDLSDYATTAELAGKQDAGDYLSATESANYYPMTGNPSGFITSVPNTYLQNTDLSTSDGKVTAISGIPLSAGGGEQVQSDWTVTAVDSPAYILNKPTEKNLVAGANVTITESNDDVTIETTEIASGLQLVAGPGIVFTVSGNNLVAKADETVLWSGALTVGNTAQMSEPVSAFERYKFYLLGHERYSKTVNEFWTDGSTAGNEPYKVNPIIFQAGADFFTINAGDCKWNTTWDNLHYVTGYNKWMPYTGSTWNQLNQNTDSPTIVKIVGINRKES